MADECLRIYTYTVDLPGKTNEAILQGPDDSYTVYLDTSLDLNGRREALLHAMKHIIYNDFNNISVDAIENRAHT